MLDERQVITLEQRPKITKAEIIAHVLLFILKKLHYLIAAVFVFVIGWIVLDEMIFARYSSGAIGLTLLGFLAVFAGMVAGFYMDGRSGERMSMSLHMDMFGQKIIDATTALTSNVGGYIGNSSMRGFERGVKFSEDIQNAGIDSDYHDNLLETLQSGGLLADGQNPFFVDGQTELDEMEKYKAGQVIDGDSYLN